MLRYIGSIDKWISLYVMTFTYIPWDVHLLYYTFAKGLCDTPLVLFALKFHILHPFLMYTPTPSVYAHPIFNCAAIKR